MSKYRIFVEVAEISACGYYRSVLPVRMLHNDFVAADIEVLASNEIDDKKWGLFDCYIYGRMPSPRTFAHAMEQYRRGARIVWDIDDDFPSIPEWSPAKKAFGPTELCYLREALGMAERIICSTWPLAQSTSLWYPEYKSKLYVLENLVYPDPFFKQLGSPDLTKILWTGSTTHVGDIGPLYAVGEYVHHHSGYLLVIYGPFPPAFANARNIVNIPWGDKMFYESILSMIAPDIALLPLTDCRFNRCKSAIKFFECTMAGALCVASDVEPFASVMADQITGLLLPHEDTEQWVSVIRDFKSHDTQDISDMKTNARREVIESYSWTTENQRKKNWRDFFLSLPK